MDDYTAANRALWDEWVAINAGSAFYDLEGFKKGGVRLRDYEVEEVGEVRGKQPLHLQCHFGIDTLSWARLGARVTGVDFSRKAIAYARSLAAELQIDARFVCSDINALDDSLDGTFDVVYTSRGVLGWLNDLTRWAGVVKHFLRPGGIFYITEIHPVAQVFDDDPGVTELRLRWPYFPRKDPLSAPTVGSYADRSATVSQAVEYFWVHSLAEVISALAGAGLRIDFLHEFPFVEWPLPFLVEGSDRRWRLPAERPGELPLFFSLKALKPDFEEATGGTGSG